MELKDMVVVVEDMGEVKATVVARAMVEDMAVGREATEVDREVMGEDINQIKGEAITSHPMEMVIQEHQQMVIIPGQLTQRQYL
jgi:hypothetical protein